MSALGRAVITRSAKTSPKVLARSGTYASVIGNYQGRVGQSSVELFRHWAKHSEWIRGAINIRRSQVASAEWDIVPLDPTRQYSKRLAAMLKDKFNTPNPSNDSYRTFIEPLIEDLIVLDAGCIEKERNLLGEVVNLWPVDGGQVKVNALWDGSNPDEARYYWYPDWQMRASFKNDDFILMMANRRTSSPVGLSPLESLKLTIEAELFGHEYNARQVSGAAPDGVMDLGEEATTEDVRRYRSYFESEINGQGAIGFVGGSKNAKWIPFRDSNRNMQFLEWQVYLVRKIAVVLGLAPQDLGITYDVNRSTSETQLQISEDRGLRPLMSLIQDYMTKEVVQDRGFGGPANNLAFRYLALNLKESTARAQMEHLQLGGVPYKEVNEARKGAGLLPLKQMEGKLIMSTPQGALDISDVPTVREYLEMLTGAKDAKAAATAKAVIDAAHAVKE